MSAGQQIYEARLRGEMWSVACHEAGLGLMVGLLVAREYADAHNLDWPPNKGHEIRADVEVRLTGTSELSEMAKALFRPKEEEKKEAKTEQRVPGRRGFAMGHISEGRGYRAYMERLLTGHTWPRIESRMDGGPYCVGSRASNVARKFAGAWELPWPIRPDFEPPPDLDKQAEAYRLRELSFPWEAIMILTGYKHLNSARMGAFYHAKKTGKDWPLDVPTYRLLPAAPTGGPPPVQVRISDQEDTHGT